MASSAIILAIGLLVFFTGLMFLDHTLNYRKEWSDFYKRYVRKAVTTPATAYAIVWIVIGVLIMIVGLAVLSKS